jgi:hypothetical protein
MVVTPLIWIKSIVLLCTIITVLFSLVGLSVFIVGPFVPSVKVFLVPIIVIFVPSFVGVFPPSAIPGVTPA